MKENMIVFIDAAKILCALSAFMFLFLCIFNLFIKKGMGKLIVFFKIKKYKRRVKKYEKKNSKKHL